MTNRLLCNSLGFFCACVRCQLLTSLTLQLSLCVKSIRQAVTSPGLFVKANLVVGVPAGIVSVECNLVLHAFFYYIMSAVSNITMQVNVNKKTTKTNSLLFCPLHFLSIHTPACSIAKMCFQIIA